MVFGILLTALVAIAFAVVVSFVDVVEGPGYKPRDGPRLTPAERPRGHLQYENDLEYVCDRDRLAGESRRSARILERLVARKPDHLFRMKVATSDHPPGSLDRDVTVREYARASVALLRARRARSRGRRSRCFERYAARLKRALDGVS